MFPRLVVVGLVATGLALIGLPAPGPAPGFTPASATVWSPASAGAAVAARPPRAPLQATYVVRDSGKVALTLVTPVPRATVRYRTASHRTRTTAVAMRSGTRVVVLPVGATEIRARAQATKKYRASRWIRATAYVPPTPAPTPPVTPPSTPAVDRWAAIDAVLASAAPIPLTPVPVTVTRAALPPVGGYALEQTCYDGVSNPSQLPVVTPNVSSLWPGALVRGDSVTTGTLDEIPIADRLPMGIGIDNILGGQTATVTVDRPSFTAMHDAINQIAPAAYHASKQYSVQVEAVSTFESLKAKLGVNASGMNWDAGFALSTDWSDSAQHVFVKLTQAYFSVGVNNPQGARGVFGPSVTAADLAPYVDADSPIGYVDSITYGREFVLVYTSKDTSFDLFAAVNGAYKGGFADVTVDSTLTWSQKMSQTSVKAFGIGGNAQQGLAAALETSASDLSALRTFVLDGATFSEDSQAAPIGYTVKSLTDNRLITLNNMDKYCVVERTIINAPTCVTALSIWNSSNPTPTVPEGWTVVPGDLNAGAGGNYVYLMYKESASTDGCVRDVAFSNVNPAPAAPPGWSLIASDLNAGSGGDFIWLLYTKAGSKDPVTDFYVSGSATPPGGYEQTVWMTGLVSPAGLGGTPAELNRNAGGANVFLSEQHTAG